MSVPHRHVQARDDPEQKQKVICYALSSSSGNGELEENKFYLHQTFVLSALKKK